MVAIKIITICLVSILICNLAQAVDSTESTSEEKSQVIGLAKLLRQVLSERRHVGLQRQSKRKFDFGVQNRYDTWNKMYSGAAAKNRLQSILS